MAQLSKNNQHMYKITIYIEWEVQTLELKLPSVLQLFVMRQLGELDMLDLAYDPTDTHLCLYV
ncbi:unnamed protein product [Trichogramma brassicae]|uniref:Uncharacterized protein n=1 Tax=Trichogramma brassicae TaxID=86971 RepID=A0A6H5IKA3_9HYME|nr:unnamed protein product [Trichogramma brassicae]